MSLSPSSDTVSSVSSLKDTQTPAADFPIGSRNEPSLWQLIVQRPHHTFSTLVYCHCFVILGFTISILGPLLPQLKQFLHVTSDSKMGFLFTIRGLGFICGSVLCGKLIHVVHIKLVLSAVLMLASACLLLIPIIQVYELSCAVHFFLGFSGSAIDLICNTVTMALWGKQGGPVLQLLHAMFGVGAVVCPATISLILKYIPTVSYSLKYSYFLFSFMCLLGIPGIFLSVNIDMREEKVEEQNKDDSRNKKINFHSASHKAQKELHPASESTQEEDMFALGSPTTANSTLDDSNITFSEDDASMGDREALHNGNHSIAKSDSTLPATNATSYRNLEDPRKTSQARMRWFSRVKTRLHNFFTRDLLTPRIVVYALMSVFLGLYVGAEVGYGSIIPTYVTQLELGTPSQAALSSSLFWVGLTAGRMTAVVLSLFLSPAVILFGDIAGCLVSVVVLFMFHRSLPVVWAATIIFGFFMSSIYPSGMAFPQVTLGFPLTGPMTALLVVGASTGEMLVPLMIEICFEVIGPVSMLIVCTICIVASLSVLIVLMLLFKPKSWMGRLVSRLRGDV